MRAQLHTASEDEARVREHGRLRTRNVAEHVTAGLILANGCNGRSTLASRSGARGCDAARTPPMRRLWRRRFDLSARFDVYCYTMYIYVYICI